MLKIFNIQVFGHQPIKNGKNKQVKHFKVDLVWRKGYAESLPRSIRLSWLDMTFNLAKTENAGFNLNLMYFGIQNFLQIVVIQK